jgi:hypothetical protein
MSEDPSRSLHDFCRAKAHICHLIPGRVRLRIPNRRGDIKYFTVLHRKLAVLDGVQVVVVNPSTSSLLISHSLAVNRLIEYAKAENLFEVTPDKPSAPVSEIISGQALSVNQRLRALSFGRLDLSSLAFLVFLCLAIVQILRGQFLVPATTLLWYAMQTLVIEGRKEDQDNNNEQTSGVGIPRK